MISKERFAELKAGDFLVFKRNKYTTTRMIIKVGNNKMLMFKKIKPGWGNTLYNYSDICRKVVGVFKAKTK